MFKLEDEGEPGSPIGVRKQDSIDLLREARPFLTGIPQVVSIRLFRDQQGHPWLSDDVIRDLYFKRSGLRPDVMVIHDLPVRPGTLRAVTVYADHLLFPIEYLMLMPGVIPRAVYLGERGWKSEAGGGREDELCRFLDDRVRSGTNLHLDTLSPLFDWIAYQRRARIRLPWVIQLVPFTKSQTLFLYQTVYKMGLFGGEVRKFQVEKALEIGDQVLTAVHEYDYRGLSGRSEAIHPTASLIAVPELTRRDSLPLVQESWVVEAASAVGG